MDSTFPLLTSERPAEHFVAQHSVESPLCEVGRRRATQENFYLHICVKDQNYV